MRSMLAALAAFGLGLGSAADAAAQNNFAAPALMDGVSADKIIQLFSDAGMQGALAGASGDGRLVELKSPEGFIMYVALSNCAGQASSAPCTLVQPYAIFNDSPPLDFVNRFNYSAANVATLMVMPDERALLGVKILLEGGVGEANLRAYLGNYMFDVVALLEGPQDGAATNVAFRPPQTGGPAPDVVPAPAAQANGGDVVIAGAQAAANFLSGSKAGGKH